MNKFLEFLLFILYKLFHTNPLLLLKNKRDIIDEFRKKVFQLLPKKERRTKIKGDSFSTFFQILIN